MKQDPEINKEELKKLLENNYSLKISLLKFVPKGMDANSYIITTVDKQKYFLKLYNLKKIKILRLKINFRDFKILNTLHDKYNIKTISYPILTIKNKIFVNTKPYRLVLYDFIEGNNDEKPLTNKQLGSFAQLLSQIHNISDNKLKIHNKEKFEIDKLKELRKLLTKVTQVGWINPIYRKKVSQLIRKNNKTILQLIQQTINLSKELKSENSKQVITHSDPYSLNLIKTKDNVSLIDWDGISLGPKEKDLWFYLVDKICMKPLLFLKKYKEINGKFHINKKIIHYYIQKNTMEDLFHYLQEINSGKQDEICLKEIKEYVLEWILNKEKMFRDIDKIIDEWNERNQI